MNSMREIPAQKSTKSSAHFLPETSKRAKLTKIGGLGFHHKRRLHTSKVQRKGTRASFAVLGLRRKREKAAPLPLFIHSSLILFLNSFSSLLESSSFIDYLAVPRDEQTIGTELKRAAGGLTPDTNKRTTGSPRTGVGRQKE